MRTNSKASVREERGPRVVGAKASEFARFIIPLVLVWLLPITAVFIWLGLMVDRESAAVVNVGPTSVSVGKTSDTADVPVTVTVRFAPPDVLRSRASGLVTAVSDDQAGQIVSGRHLLSVDDIAIRAQVGSSPIVRNVGPESSGADVERVASLLASTGYLEATVGSSYTWDLRMAINGWNRDAGLPANGVFDVSSTIFVAENSVSLAGLDVVVGVQIAVGDQVGQLVASLESVAFASATDASLAPLSGVPVTLQFGDETFPIQDRDAVAADTELLAFLTGAVSSGSATYAPDDAGGVYEGGRLQLAEAIEYATVPTRAVYVAPSGVTCVFIVDDEGEHSAARTEEARPVGSSGVTAVDLALAGEIVASDATNVAESVLDECR